MVNWFGDFKASNFDHLDFLVNWSNHSKKITEAHFKKVDAMLQPVAYPTVGVVLLSCSRSLLDSPIQES